MNYYTKYFRDLFFSFLSTMLPLLPHLAEFQSGLTPFTSECHTSATEMLKIVHLDPTPFGKWLWTNLIVGMTQASTSPFQVVTWCPHVLTLRQEINSDGMFSKNEDIIRRHFKLIWYIHNRLLRHNFNRHFSTNRAPLGLHFHASWLKSKREFREELVKFIDEMLARNDVYFVTMLQVWLLSFYFRKSTFFLMATFSSMFRLFNGCKTPRNWQPSVTSKSGRRNAMSKVSLSAPSQILAL